MKQNKKDKFQKEQWPNDKPVQEMFDWHCSQQHQSYGRSLLKHQRSATIANLDCKSGIAGNPESLTDWMLFYKILIFFLS